MEFISEDGVKIEILPEELDRSAEAKMWLNSLKWSRFGPREMDLATAIMTNVYISTPEDEWEQRCLMVSTDLLEFASWLSQAADGEIPKPIKIEASMQFSVLPQSKGVVGIRVDIKGSSNESLGPFVVETNWVEGNFKATVLKEAAESLQKELEQFPNYWGI